MSLKRNKSMARAMPVETILTRNKSAQLKQKKLMNEKEGEVKSNANLKRRSLKQKISDKQIEWKEFRPDKSKRKIASQTVPLKPKHNYTVVADLNQCNKRKMNVPKKVRILDIPPVECEDRLPSDTEELSVAELIILFNATEEMTDEDFMEILTCPSPVWWEDPPPGYTEDPISAEFMVKKEVNNDKKDEIVANKTLDKISTNIENNSVKDIKKDTKYVTKSRNLESVLGNLKNKLNESIVKPCCSKTMNNSVHGVVKENDRMNSNTEVDGSVNSTHRNETKRHTAENNNIEIIELTSDETDQEDLVNKSLDESLMFLENMDIPIGNE